MRHNDANNMTHTPYYMCHFQIFDKIDSFRKRMFQMSLKYLDYVFEEPLNLHIVVD